MTKIEHTNLIIDDFTLSKREPKRSYSYILTHIHTDHLKGLHDGWNYGPIYCSEQTKALLEYKFPNINNVIAIPLYTPTEITLSFSLSVTVTFFDANHCIGAVMVLIEGYMGNVLYTGDMRFDKEIFKNYKHLYPPDKLNEKFEGCSKHIDILYVDNTFLKKKFNFPPKATVIQMAIEFIQGLLDLDAHSRVYIGLDSFGKQEVLLALAMHFNMYIVVDEQRFDLMCQTSLNIDMFTTLKSDGIVQVVRKDRLYDCLKNRPDSMGIILSGWVNQPAYRSNGTVYCLPYSLHSNYREIHEFVNSIRPTVIYPIVRQFPDQNRLFYAQGREVMKRDLMFNQDLFELEKGNYDKQIQELRSLYCSPSTKQFHILNTDVQLQKKIDQQLRPPDLSNLFREEKVIPIHMQVVQRKKYKLANNRNELEISRLKNQIQLKKKLIEGEKIEIILEDQKKPSNTENPSSDKNEVIAIEDDDPGIELMKDDPIEIDPLFQPIKSKNLVIKERKPRSTISWQHERKRYSDVKIVQSIQTKSPKDKLNNNLTLDSFFKKEKSVAPQNVVNENHQKVSNQSPQKINAQSMLINGANQGKDGIPSVENEGNIPRIENGFPGVGLDNLQQIKILNNKQDVLRHLKRSPEELTLIKKLFQSYKRKTND